MKSFLEFILEEYDEKAFPRKSKIDPTQKRAITNYMGQGYSYANPKMRSHIDKLIRTSPWTTKEQTVYRGVTSLPDTDDSGHHTHPHITSYSRNMDVAKEFTKSSTKPGAIIRLKVPAKSRTFRTEEDDSGEQEQLFRAGSRIKINREPSEHHVVTTEHHSLDGKVSYHEKKVPIHDAELVDDNTSKKFK